MDKRFGLPEVPGVGNVAMKPTPKAWKAESSDAVIRVGGYRAVKRMIREQLRQSKAAMPRKDTRTAAWCPARETTVATMTQVTMSHLKVVDDFDGSIRMYWFRNPTTVDLIFAKGKVVARLAYGANYSIFGTDRHRRGAIESLCRNVDQQVQRFLPCVPMQLCDEEQMIRESLESLFDLDRYRASRRTEAIESARFSRVDDRFRFECFGGPDIVIKSNRCHGLFGDLVDGDWCEIAVRKSVSGGQVESIQFRQTMDEPSILSDEEFSRELSELPKADFPPLSDGPIQSR